MVSNKMIVTFMLIAIAALACAGCSDDNPVTLVNPVDTAPPAVPSNLSVDYSANKAIISWDMSTVDPDLAGYIVTRENCSVTEILVDQPIFVSRYEDANPKAGSTLYSVYAVDNVGNESAIATVNLTIPLNHRTYDISR